MKPGARSPPFSHFSSEETLRCNFPRRQNDRAFLSACLPAACPASSERKCAKSTTALVGRPLKCPASSTAGDNITDISSFALPPPPSCRPSLLFDDRNAKMSRARGRRLRFSQSGPNSVNAMPRCRECRRRSRGQAVSCCSEMDFGENIKESSPLRSLRPFDGLSSPRRASSVARHLHNVESRVGPHYERVARPRGEAGGRANSLQVAAVARPKSFGW